MKPALAHAGPELNRSTISGEWSGVNEVPEQARKKSGLSRRRRGPLARPEFPSERLDLLADAVPHMLWSASVEGLHDYHNSRWYEFTGSKVGVADGEGWIDFIHEDDREQAREAWQHAIHAGEAYEAEHRLVHHRDEHRWVVSRALPIRDPDGAVRQGIPRPGLGGGKEQADAKGRNPCAAHIFPIRIGLVTRWNLARKKAFPAE